MSQRNGALARADEQERRHYVQPASLAQHRGLLVRRLRHGLDAFEIHLLDLFLRAQVCVCARMNLNMNVHCMQHVHSMSTA